MWQQIVVGLIVALAALHAAAKFLPLATRQHIVYALARRGLPQDRLARFFNTESSCGDGCSSCGSCDSDAPSTPPADGPARRVIPIRVQR